MDKFITFLREVRVELSKVSWPTRDQITTYTITVVTLTFFLALFLGVVDSGLGYILNKFVIR